MKRKAYSETGDRRKRPENGGFLEIGAWYSSCCRFRLEQGVYMANVRYLPAARAKAGGCRLGRLSVRTGDDREIGKLLGFVIDTNTQRLHSLVVEAPHSTVELPMGSVQFHAASLSLRVVQGDVIGTEFPAESVPHVTVEDLWIPVFNSAA